MSTGAHQLLLTVPAGSGVFRLIDIPGAQYQTGYVSTSPGSFKELGESGNWYGTTIKTCFAEVEPCGVPVYEVTKFKQDTPFLSAFNLPSEIQQAIYDDRDLPSGSYSKSHIVLEFARQYLPLGSYSGVYFPTRRNDGGVLTYDPRRIPVEFIYTGIDPPPRELFR
ncbi:MAG: hypothetical protein HY674_22405 [Chloroflexi bacterium]|nr:hypothetical protein [Chloroflexota bacterium]